MTFVGAHGNGQDAPIADLPALDPEPGGSNEAVVRSDQRIRALQLQDWGNGDFRRRCQPPVHSTTGLEYEEIDKLAHGLNRRSRRYVLAGRCEPFLKFLIGKLREN